MTFGSLEVEFIEGNENGPNRVLPFAVTQLFDGGVRGFEKLCGGDDVKTVYKLTLDVKDIKHNFWPGDTIGVLPLNDEKVVDELLGRLGLDSVANSPCQLKISENSTKKNAATPKHLPLSSTLRNIFMKNVDIQAPHKKLFLKTLLKFTTDPNEITLLEQATSVKTSREYLELITGPGRTLLGLLNTFRSCQPPIGVLLENLPPLQPRPYSISSSPLQTGGFLEITFFIVTRDDSSKGLCTGWLEKVSENKIHSIPFYFRQPNAFRLPEDESIPIILVATGTGIAPFRGFLQHRLLRKSSHNQIWLFYGCRYANKDFLYKDEIDDYFKKKVLTKVSLAFSREGDEKCYVQSCIEKFGEEFTDWCLKRETRVFVCGNGRTMVKDVRVSVVNNFVKFGRMNPDEAEKCLSRLEKENRYVIDNWA